MTQIQWTKPVCQLDREGIYIGQTEADLDVHACDGSYLIPGGCIDTAPPEPRDGHAARWTGEAWEYIPDHRGKTAYRTDDGSVVQIDRVGELPDDLTFEPRPSEAHEWVDGAWVENKELAAEIKAVALAKARAGRLAALNTAAQAYINRASGADLLPAYEVQSWPLQALEAKAWQADPTAATPILDGIAAARGVAADTLKAAALRKTLAYEAVCARVAGRRQVLQTAVEKAKTVADIDAVAVDFDFDEDVTA